MNVFYSGLGLLLLFLAVFRAGRSRTRSPGRSDDLWSLAWRQFRKGRLNRLGMYFVGLIFFVACFADFLSSDLPILLHRGGETWVVPNLTHPARLNLVNNTQLLSGGLARGDWALMPPIPYGPLEDLGTMRTQRLEAPNMLHPLGTDDRGRDVAARMIHGTRVTLTVGILAVGLYVVIGILLGASAGYFGGWWIHWWGG